MQVSGPGTATCADAAAASTTATFSAAGTYVMCLSAGDGLLTTTDTMQVVMSAGASTTVTAPTNMVSGGGDGAGGCGAGFAAGLIVLQASAWLGWTSLRRRSRDLQRC
jgi:hypothetical protein